MKSGATDLGFRSPSEMLVALAGRVIEEHQFIGFAQPAATSRAQR
mgnify:CR=1 FL=1